MALSTNSPAYSLTVCPTKPKMLHHASSPPSPTPCHRTQPKSLQSYWHRTIYLQQPRTAKHSPVSSSLQTTSSSTPPFWHTRPAGQKTGMYMYTTSTRQTPSTGRSRANQVTFWILLISTRTIMTTSLMNSERWLARLPRIFSRLS